MLIQPDWPVPASIKAFTTTRLSDIDQINVPSEPCRLKQVHGARVIALTDWQPEVEADASFTREKGKVCVVKTADCLPILLADKNATVVAAIHAGWRSLAHGIIDNTIVALNVDLASLYAWFGPAISQQHFEVGEDVLSAFQENQFDTKKHFKQIIVTTHNPAILDGLNLKDDSQRLFVISRNSEGHTRAERINYNEKRTMKLSEVWTKGFIGGLPENF